MSKIELNAKYAPGISTYGAPGAQGKQGFNGYSIYYVPYNIESLTQPADSQEIELIRTDILNNTFISTNISGTKTLLDRSYQVNDLFILPNSKIFKLSRLNREYNSVEFQEIGILNKSFPFTTSSNGYIYNPKTGNLLLGNFDPENLPNSINSPLVIFEEDGKFLTLGKNDNTMSIVKDSSYFGIVSDNPIVFNTGIFINNDSTEDYITNTYGDKYFKVATYDIPNIDNIKTAITFNDNTINLSEITTDKNLILGLNIVYKNSVNETVEYNILGLSCDDSCKIPHDKNSIIGINLIVSYNNNYISKTYKLNY